MGNTKLPSFVVFGASKSGTHWINECLRAHPQVYLTPKVHEIFFFDRYFDRGVDWYKNYFEGAGDDQTIGDITPTYLANPDAPKNLHQTIPSATLIASLRNPVSRAHSKYLHAWRKGDIAPGLSFRQACQAAPEILTDGEYYRCLQNWFQYYEREQIHLLILDDAKADPNRFIQEICSIIGIQPDFEPSEATGRTNEHQSPRALWLAKLGFRISRVLHDSGMHGVVQFAKRAGLRRVFLKDGVDSSKDPPPMSDADRQWAVEYFADDIAKLSGLVDRDLTELWGGSV